MTVFVELAPAKVNLTLRVLGRRHDGYHELQSLVAFADVGDVVTLAIDRPVAISMRGPFAAAIDGGNILDRALALLAAESPQLLLGAVTLEKRLPVAAGLGGGSADAGALLRAIRRANPQVSRDVQWLDVARRLGADVPVCFGSTACVMSGIGENIEPIIGLPKLPAVLVNPQAAVPADKTARIFRELAAAPLAEPPPAPPALSGPFRDPAPLVAYLLSQDNDLVAPARTVVPEIAAVEAALAQQDGALLVRLSGAGPTCFAVFDSPERAIAAQARLASSHPRWWIATATLG